MFEQKKITPVNSPLRATPEQKEKLLAALQDVVMVCEYLLPYCQTVDELVGMTKLATENEGQLNIILSLVLAKNDKQRAVS